MAKYDQLSTQLRERILQGDYALRGLPAERQLAVEHGVSYMTARKALQQLVEDGVLVRGSNGRVEINRRAPAVVAAPPVALLSPSFSSSGFDRWRDNLARVVEEAGMKLRQILYTHWDDPVILESLEGFSGVFLLAGAEEIPASLVKRLATARGPMVLLDDDLSGSGIPSVRQFSTTSTQVLLDHLEERGYATIDCLNVQPLHSIVEARIGQWQTWLGARRYAGELLNFPVAAYEHPYTRAYQVMQERMARAPLAADALFCTTMPAAIGAMRAMHEAGIRPGEDIGVAVVDGEGIAEYQIPSLTALEPGDIVPLLRVCLQWMAQGGQAWRGPLLLEPAVARLAVRESSPRREHLASNRNKGTRWNLTPESPAQLILSS